MKGKHLHEREHKRIRGIDVVFVSVIGICELLRQCDIILLPFEKWIFLNGPSVGDDDRRISVAMTSTRGNIAFF